MSETTFDAIVIGAGMSGSWVAKELCDQGIKTLLLERGPDVRHIKDYPTANMNPWEFEHRGKMPHSITKDNPVLARCYAFREDNAHFFVKDTDHPYVQDQPFDWIRGYQVGGKSLMWARETQRWSEFDFEGPARDGIAVDWPIRYKDLAPWYSKVEHFVGIAGNKDGLPELPDGDFLPAWDLNCMIQHFQQNVSENYEDRKIIFGRVAHLSEPRDIHFQQGRGQCMQRLECERGCPLGGYFSANSSTIPWAEKTGNLTLRPDSVVHSIIYDEEAGKASGVRVIDANTKEVTEYSAKVVFVNAGTINTIGILLNSTSDRFPNGIGNDSGLLGKYVGFHNYRGIIRGKYYGLDDKDMQGRIPAKGYIPRFQNLRAQETDFIRGYSSTFSARRARTPIDPEGLGGELKGNLLGEKPYRGPWICASRISGEVIPKESNYVKQDETKKDEWGIPLLSLSIGYDENDEKMIKHFFEQFEEMYKNAGIEDIELIDTGQAPGLDIHEMGGVRMGYDPATSLLNGRNQMHLCKNVIVSDGACMTSTSTQNPSLTYMAIAARAANLAIEDLKKGEI